jgi:hypothetical protein
MHSTLRPTSRRSTIPPASAAPRLRFNLLGTPDSPKFLVNRAGVAQGSLTTARYNLVNWTNAPLNVGNYFDLTTDKFQPLTPGYYNISFQVFCTGANNGGYVGAGLFKNQSTWPNTGAGLEGQGLLVVGSSGQGATQTMLPIFFNGSTDYLNAGLYIDHAGSGSLDGANYNTFMRGTLVP